MKYLSIFGLFIVATFSSHAQVSAYDCSVSSPNVPTVALEASEPGNFHKPCVLLDAVNSYNFSNDQELHITADQTIHIKEDFHSGQYTNNGNMHLEIKPQEDLDVLVMNYPDLYNVERFGKLELAVVLPQNIQNAVDDFVANGQSATNVNPFDPQQLEIKAYFSPLYNGSWQYPWVRDAFYYENYQHSPDTLSWQEVPTQGSKFRVRFAPRATGLWRCAISVSCPVTGEYWDLNEFQFTVIDTGKPDYVRTGENGKYFKIGGDPFYTWGLNMPTQGRNTAYDASIGARPKDYNLYFEQLRELKNAGGNYFRYMNQPYSTEIEFEHLGDYSDRMFRAWEMDRVIDSLETLDLRMHWCLSYNLPTSYTGIFNQFWWDWSSTGEAGITCVPLPGGFPDDEGYCYHTDSVYGVMTVDSFFTDTDLLRFHKNRMRYIISRWGHSTRIGTFDFMNEINFSGIQFAIDSTTCQTRPDIWEVKPYFHDPAYAQAVSHWQGEMARYIKDDLEHTDHLLTAHYGGPPNEVPNSPYEFPPGEGGIEEEGISTLAGDSSFINPYIDICGWSDYEESIKHYEWAVSEIEYYRNTHTSTLNKPFYFVEIGNGTHYCDDLFSYKQMFIMSLFTGAAGAGLPWGYNNSIDQWELTSERLEGWEPLQYMPLHLAGVDLNHDNWSPAKWVSTSNKSEIVYLKNQISDATKAIGIINNRTVNRYTMRESWCDWDENGISNCDCLDDSVDFFMNFSPEWRDRVEIGPVGPGNELKIGGLDPYKSYIVEYFNVQTGSMNGIETKTSNGWGRINLGYPTLSATFEASNGNQNGSMILVKVRRSNEPQFRTSDTTNQFKGNDYIFDLRQKNLITATFEPTNYEGRINSSILDFTAFEQSRPELIIVPNPTNGQTSATLKWQNSPVRNWKITDAYGKVMVEVSNTNENLMFDSGSWNSGMYFVTCIMTDNLVTEKFIVK